VQCPHFFVWLYEKTLVFLLKPKNLAFVARFVKYVYESIIYAPRSSLIHVRLIKT